MCPWSPLPKGIGIDVVRVIYTFMNLVETTPNTCKLKLLIHIYEAILIRDTIHNSGNLFEA